jgi:hypothetical protein
MLRLSTECNWRSVCPAPLLLALIGCVALVGCGEERSLEDIEKEKRSLDVLYMTTETGKEIVAPNDKGVFVDEKTGELCFPAYVCMNPDCPGEKKGDRPFVFIHNDVLLKPGPDGKPVRNEIPPGKDPVTHIKSLGGFLNPTCTACWKIRKPRTETPAQRQQYIEWAQPYNSPETAKRLVELEEEYQRRAKAK